VVTRRSAQITGLRHEQPVTPKYSVVIPVYNSARYLRELHARLRSVMHRLNEPYEILFVNDASPDGSLSVLRGIQDGDDTVVVIDLMRNFGQHNAVVCGFESSAGEFVITMDDDLQHPPRRSRSSLPPCRAEKSMSSLPDISRSATRRLGMSQAG